MGLEFGLKDIVDIVLVALLFYQLYKLFRGTGVNNIFIGILSLIIVWFFVVYIFQLELLGSILNQLMNVGIVALIVIFQNEIRRFFFMTGFMKVFTMPFKGGLSLSTFRNVMPVRYRWGVMKQA